MNRYHAICHSQVSKILRLNINHFIITEPLVMSSAFMLLSYNVYCTVILVATMGFCNSNNVSLSFVFLLNSNGYKNITLLWSWESFLFLGYLVI